MSDSKPVHPRNVSVIVTASPIPSHPSPRIILETVNSLDLLGLGEHAPILLVHDAVPPDAAGSEQDRYADYLIELKEAVKDRQNVEVHLLDTWGHLVGGVTYGIDAIKTQYVLIVQHDLPFVRSVPISKLVELMEHRREIAHIRFNKRTNLAEASDGSTRSRRRFFSQVSFPNSEFALIQTLSWSDNNHLTTRGYYRDLVLPLIGDQPTAMEKVLNPLARRRFHPILGTYIFGAINEPAVIGNLDGRKTGLTPCATVPDRQSIVRLIDTHRRLTRLIRGGVWRFQRSGGWLRHCRRVRLLQLKLRVLQIQAAISPNMGRASGRHLT